MVRRIWLALVAIGLLTAPTSATTLFAGVSHSESLTPLFQRTPFSQPESPSVDRSNQDFKQPMQVRWIRIPTWMGGTWSKKGDLTTSITDLRSGLTTATNEFTEDFMTIAWGHQQDAQGNIWHAFILPSEREGQSKGNRVIFNAIAMKAEAITPAMMIGRVQYIVTEFDREGTLISRFQQESLSKYGMKDDMLENQSSNRVFTYEGRPVKEGTLISNFHRDAPFKPTRYLNDLDLEASFAKFMAESKQNQSATAPPP